MPRRNGLERKNAGREHCKSVGTIVFFLSDCGKTRQSSFEADKKASQAGRLLQNQSPVRKTPVANALARLRRPSARHHGRIGEVSWRGAQGCRMRFGLRLPQ